ncbi:hypothetical protein T10_56 [Trichinella papuae]|uniref:Uncharacterized protein n=1 Tax=Trichinella papuae TaxID=268474 RepID=A0A0V1NA27_9BILA|nr:hypothetical protein T10_56 [Trichinella papuae]
MNQHLTISKTDKCLRTPYKNVNINALELYNFNFQKSLNVNFLEFPVNEIMKEIEFNISYI